MTHVPDKYTCKRKQLIYHFYQFKNMDLESLMFKF